MNIYPLNYALQFEPNFNNFTFMGKETIEVIIKKPSKRIILNSAELKIFNCNILFKNKTVKCKTHLNAKKEELVITTTEKIYGKLILCINFQGILNDKLLGFYKSQYKNKNGKTEYLATTQFEAADARRAFPCWDEPEFKATFDVTIITKKNLVALSNMPVISKKSSDKKLTYKFARTPKMSTYLLYLGVGNFEFLPSMLGKTLVRVVTTKGNKAKGKMSLEFAKKFLKEFEKYFGIKYPLPKLDLIAIPDFAAGAMENWGAITFRETILLYDPKTSSTRTKQFIAEVISHELAHQWFGNLVTMKWWNDLWLNESFATFMATKIVDKFYKSWKLWDQFLEDAMNQAMSLDSLKSSHPIDVKVRNPSEIREIFDSISYDKGGCVLRMLEHYVGKKNFQIGLQKYLKKHMYKNTVTDDLWLAIGKVAKKPVKTVMSSWVKQVGYPLVTVKKNKSKLYISQKRFLAESKSNTPKTLWHIPITISNGKTTSQLIIKQNNSIPFKNTNNFIVNPGRTGFYKVKYDQKTLLKIQDLVAHKKMGHVDRWAIQNDLHSLMISGEIALSDYVDFLQSYHDETDYLICSNISGNLYSLYLSIFEEKFSDKIKPVVIQHLQLMFNRLGWDNKKNEKHTDALLRSFVITALGKLGDEYIIAEAEKRHKIFLKTPLKINPDIHESIFSLVAWNGNKNTHSKLIILYKNAKTQEEKLRFLSALCSFKDKELLLKTLKFSLTDHVRSQNMQLPIIRIAANPYGKKIIWPWLKKHWRELNKKIGVGNPLVNRIIASLALSEDQNMENDIRKFFTQNTIHGAERTLEQTLEKIRIKSKFLLNLRNEFTD